MEITEFIKLFADAIEVETPEDLSPDTVFKDLDEWSSISVMLTVAFFDEEFDKEITEKEIRMASTIKDLYGIVTA